MNTTNSASPSDPPGGITPGLAAPRPSAALLQALAEETGHSVDAQTVRQALAAPPTGGQATDPLDWVAVLTPLGEKLQLRLTSVRLSLREAAALAAPGAPLVTCRTERGGVAEWFMLRRDRRGRPRMVRFVGQAAEPLAGSVRAQARELQLDPNAPLEWVTFQPQAPLDGARAGGEGHDALSPPRRLLRLLRPESRDLMIVGVFSAGIGVLSLAIPIALQALVNFVAFGGLLQPLFVLAAILLGILVFAGAIRTLQAYVVEIIQRRIFVRVVADLAYRLPRVRTDAYDRQHGPELVNRFFDVLTVQKTCAGLLLEGIALVLQTVIGLLVLAFYHPFLLGFAALLVVAIFVVVVVFGRGAVQTAIKESKAKYAVAASLEEIARNPMTYKLGGGPRLAFERADTLAHDYLFARQKHFRVVLRHVVGSVAVQAFASTALLTLGAMLVMRGELTLGQLVAAELIVTIVLSSLLKIGKQLESYYDLLAAVDKLGQLIDLPLERGTGSPLAGRAGPASLVFCNVGFGYDAARPVFEGFSLEAPPGARLGLRGQHGSGKSTLAELVFGLRVPTSGRIELDGQDLRELRLDALREQVAVIQGLEIIEGTVIENVQIGRSEMGTAVVVEALRSVGLLDVVRELPDGLDTRLHTDGSPLSLGQARALMVARALAGNPRLLVLDDVLDDMDQATRRQVCARIFAKDAPWTLLVLSREDDVLRWCDRVVDLPVRTNGPRMSVQATSPEGA